MSYMDDYQLAQDEQEELKRRIQEWAYAPTAQAAPTQPTEQEVVNQMAAEQVAAQPQQVEMTPQIQPAQVQQQALPMPNNELAATAAQFAPMSRAELMLAQQAYGLKGAWEEAQKAGDTEGANRIHDMAAALFKSGGDYGIDTSRFNSDVTRDQVGQLLQANYAKAIEDVGNMITPQEYFTKVVDEQMAQGVSERAARKIAINQTRAYEGEYARKMAVAMDAYGLNDNGSMNNHSGLIQTLAYLNNPAGAAIYDRYYANPKEQWQYDKELEAARFMNTLRQANSLQNYKQTRALNQDKYAFQGGENEANRQHQMTMLAAKARIDAMAEADKRAWIEANPELAGILGYGRGSRRTERGGNEDEISDKDKIDVYNAQDIYNSGLSLVGDDVNNAIAELDKMKKKEADPDTRKRLEGMKYALQARREAVAWNNGGQKGGYDNFLNYYQWAVDNNAYDLIKDLEEVYNAARREKERAEKASEPKETPKQQPRDIPKGYWPEYKIGGAYGINRPY